MNAASPSHKSKNAPIFTESTDHLKNLDIEAFQKLLNASLIRLDTRRTPLLIGEINFHRRLERTSQRSRTVSKHLIRLKFWQRLDCTLGTLVYVIHKCLQIREIFPPNTPDKTKRQKGKTSQTRQLHFLPPSSL